MRSRALVRNIVNSVLDPIGLEIRSKGSLTESSEPTSSSKPAAPRAVSPSSEPVSHKNSPAVKKGPGEVDWEYHAPRLGRFKDKHKGERCFIIGNGPSLNLMALVGI